MNMSPNSKKTPDQKGVCRYYRNPTVFLIKSTSRQATWKWLVRAAPTDMKASLINGFYFSENPDKDHLIGGSHLGFFCGGCHSWLIVRHRIQSAAASGGARIGLMSNRPRLRLWGDQSVNIPLHVRVRGRDWSIIRGRTLDCIHHSMTVLIIICSQ